MGKAKAIAELWIQTGCSPELPPPPPPPGGRGSGDSGHAKHSL